MQYGESVGYYCVRVKAWVNKRQDLIEEVNNKVIMKKVLRTLFLEWNQIEIIIEKSKDLSTLDYDQFIGSLMYHEERLKDSTSLNVGGVEEKPFSCKEGEAIASGHGRVHGRDHSPSRGRDRGRRGALRGRGRGRGNK